MGSNKSAPIAAKFWLERQLERRDAAATVALLLRSAAVEKPIPLLLRHFSTAALHSKRGISSFTFYCGALLLRHSTVDAAIEDSYIYQTSIAALSLLLRCSAVGAGRCNLSAFIWSLIGSAFVHLMSDLFANTAWPQLSCGRWQHLPGGQEKK